METLPLWSAVSYNALLFIKLAGSDTSCPNRSGIVLFALRVVNESATHF